MPPRPVRLRGFARVKAIGRVIFYLGCVNLVLTGLWVSHARAQVEQSLQRGGLELLQQLGPELTGDAQEVRLNGQSMFLSSRVLKQRGVAEVLTAVERHCQKPEAGPPRIGDTAVPDDANWDFGRLLISRLEDPEKRSGQVACLASPDRDRSFDGFTKRLARFAQKFDLAELGQMRYAVARHDAVGNRTHLLLVWSEGSLSVPALFPAEGDAPGSDSAVAPRPPAAVRVLSAEVPDHPYALRLYDTDRSFQEARLVAEAARRAARGPDARGQLKSLHEGRRGAARARERHAERQDRRLARGNGHAGPRAYHDRRKRMSAEPVFA
jgi:hypothetical protein